ncbi:MAG: GPW/gp25 family protein [bacterium]|nr:GPW/gp25 family protein [bacterium]
MDGNFLGAGWCFPFNINTIGNVELSYFEKSIAESVRLILGTSKGERIMRPDFGCEINDMVFAPNNANTRSLIEYYISEALLKWEPRIDLQKVEAISDPENEARINIGIEYKVREVNNAFNLVYPFYLERGESDTQSQFG